MSRRLVVTSAPAASSATRGSRAHVTHSTNVRSGGLSAREWTPDASPERQLPSESLDVTFVTNSDPVSPSEVNIFESSRVVLFKTSSDALIAERFINDAGIQAVEIKYYNRSFGQSARSFLVHFNYTAIPGSNVFPSIRRSPILVNAGEYTSFGTLLKPAGGTGRFGYLYFVDAATSQTPISVRNENETFTDEYINIFP